MTRKAKYDFKVARLKRNLTISELACKMKIQPKKINTWEKFGNKIQINNLIKFLTIWNSPLMN